MLALVMILQLSAGLRTQLKFKKNQNYRKFTTVKLEKQIFLFIFYY